MSRRKGSAVTLAVTLGYLLASSDTQAYPIFYACNSQGQLREHVDTQELQTLVLAATDEDQLNAKILKLCGGLHECFSVLKQALMLTRESLEISNSMLQKEVLQLIADKNGELNGPVDASLSTTAKNLMEMAQDIYACRAAQEDLPEDSFRLYDINSSSVTYEDGGLVLQNVTDNEFGKINGVKSDGTATKIGLAGVRNIVETAVATGLDPYVALAVNWWEENTLDKHFTLDFNAMIVSLGCSTKAGMKGPSLDKNEPDDVARRQAILDHYESLGGAFIYDYGGQAYTFSAGVHENAKLTQIMKDYAKGTDAQPQSSLYCAQAEGDFMADARGQFLMASRDYVDASKWSVDKACCLKVPFGTDQYDAISDLLATKFMGDRLQSIPLGKDDPAYMLQSFNGFSTLMGITERGSVKNPIVGQYRLGLNLKTDPQYGLQGMDMILNTYMSNPAIRALVDATEKRMGKVPKSVLCVGKKGGAYAIDSDLYVNKQKKAQRFATIIDKDWDSLTASQKSLMQFEWALMAENRKLRNAKLSDDENAKYRGLVEQMDGISGDAAKWAFYRSKIYPNYRKTLYQVSLRTWDRVNDQAVLDARARIRAVNQAD